MLIYGAWKIKCGNCGWSNIAETLNTDEKGAHFCPSCKEIVGLGGYVELYGNGLGYYALHPKLIRITP